jgi:tetraacyldisaccharide 4'-kinase
VVGARALEGGPVEAVGRVVVVTATGRPDAVRASAEEAGFEVAGLAAYRDHHWFAAAEVRREAARARAAGAALLVTAKDAVRWPRLALDVPVRVLEVAWQWLAEGERVERLALGGEAR